MTIKISRSHPEIKVWGDKEDKDELKKRIKQASIDENIVIIPHLLEVLDLPIVIGIVSGLVSVLKIIYDFLKEKKTKNIQVSIVLTDGKVISVNSKNTDELEVLIKQIGQEKK